MAEEKKSSEKTIEMRLAELEDKVSKIHITEEELKAYHKVSALIGGQQAQQATGQQYGGVEAQIDPTAMSPYICVIRPVSRIVPRIVPRIVNECTCGPCLGGNGGGFGGGFGGFGMG